MRFISPVFLSGQILTHSIPGIHAMVARNWHTDPHSAQFNGVSSIYERFLDACLTVLCYDLKEPDPLISCFFPKGISINYRIQQAKVFLWLMLYCEVMKYCKLIFKGKFKYWYKCWHIFHRNYILQYGRNRNFIFCLTNVKHFFGNFPGESL